MRLKLLPQKFGEETIMVKALQQKQKSQQSKRTVSQTFLQRLCKMLLTRKMDKHGEREMVTTKHNKTKQRRKKNGNQTQPAAASAPSTSQNTSETRGNYKGNGPPIFCWYCKRIGHFQLKCTKRIDDNAPMIFKGKPVTSNSNKKIMAMSDFENTSERDEWHKRLKAQSLINPNEAGSDFY